MHGPYQGKSLDYVRNLDHREVVEWADRFNRCPWGPKADARRHYQLCALQVGKDTDLEVFQFDRTSKVKHEIKMMLMTDEEEEQKAAADAEQTNDILTELKRKLGV